MKTLTQEQINRLTEILDFYGEGDNFEWEGCHCHGHWTRCERGDMAEEGKKILYSLNKCDKCCYELTNGFCLNVLCNDCNWEEWEKRNPKG